MKQILSLNSLMEYECVEGKEVKLSRMSELLVKKERLRQEIENVTSLLSSKDDEIALLKAKLVLAQMEDLVQMR